MECIGENSNCKNFSSIWKMNLKNNENLSHNRTIIHLDMDCFYAQVEEVQNPSLREFPLGIQQKNFVVTCNYKAREYGVRKLMIVSEAKRLCPELVLVNGEDLTPYRQMSQKIFEILLNYTPFVEKLGFDENFMDITTLVEEEQQKYLQCISETHKIALPPVIGHVYPPESLAKHNEKTDLIGIDDLDCNCGCATRLSFGSRIAQEIREELFMKLGLTCTAGISHNKLLAKLIGCQHKPNQQTTLLYPLSAARFLRELADLKRITGIGQRTESLLLENGIANIGELQDCNIDVLRKKLGYETAQKVKDLVFGNDNSIVRTTGKPKSISLEDSCKPLSVRKDVEERFRLLLLRLMEQVGEDGRIPVCIKVILRKYDSLKKSSHRETKQANILPSLFRTVVPKSNSYTNVGKIGQPSRSCEVIKVMLADGAQEKLLKIIMRLFERVVDLNKPFNITLIGLAFSKFQQRKMGSSSIANFLIKDNDLEVQSVTSLTNFELITSSSESLPAGNLPSSSNSINNNNRKQNHITGDDLVFRSSPLTFQSSDQFHRRRTNTASPVPMLIDNGSESAATNSDFSDVSETEVEPSPKKTRIGHLFLNTLRNKRTLSKSQMASNESLTDVASPSKLRVCDLRLNSRDSDRDFPVNSTTGSNSSLVIASDVKNNAHYSMVTNDNFIPNNESILLSTNTTLTNESNIFTDSMSVTSTCSDINSLSNEPNEEDLYNIHQEESFISPALHIENQFNEEETNNSSNSTTTCTSSKIVLKDIGNEEITTNKIDGGNDKKVMMDSIICPSNVDMEIFKALPIDVQNELLLGWQRSLATAITNGSQFTTTSATVMSVDGDGNGSLSTKTGVSKTNSMVVGIGNSGGGLKNGNVSKTAASHSHRTQKNTLYHYFLRNK